MKRNKTTSTTGDHYYQTVFQMAPDGMSISRLDDGLFIDVNDSFCAMFGHNKADIIGQTSYQLNFWNNISDRDLLIEKLARADTIENFFTLILDSDGCQVNVLLSAKVFELNAEKCLLLTYRNVTSQTRAVDALRESEKKFKDIFETIPDNIIISDHDGRICDINPIFEEKLGYPREDIIGKTTFEVGLWENPEQRSDFLAQLQEQGKVQNFEMTARDSNQRLKRFLVSAKQVTINDEQRILSLARDITQLKVTEENLRAEEKKYRELSLERQIILEAIKESLILWSEDCEVIWANPNAEKYLKKSQTQIIGKTCQELCRSDHDPMQCPVHLGLSNREQIEIIERYMDGDIWSVKTFPIFSAQGQVSKVLTLAVDITEKFRLREEANRSARLAALGELAAGVAHEINNPTGLILLNSSLVRDVIADLKPLLHELVQDPDSLRLGGLTYNRAMEELPEVLTETIESGHRIKQIVEDLKDFSRPAPQDTFKPIDLNEVVRKTLRIMRLVIDKATDYFVVDYGDNLSKVMGNARQLEQVLVNLIANACQALQKRSECLIVAVYNQPDVHNVCIKIWDEGIGIDPEIISQITDPFFTTKREQGGTGLGLSVSSRIIEDHQGHIYFESTPGYGTTVTVHLPAIAT